VLGCNPAIDDADNDAVTIQAFNAAQTVFAVE